MSPETCRAELKRLINEKVVESCWLFTSLLCCVDESSSCATMSKRSAILFECYWFRYCSYFGSVHGKTEGEVVHIQGLYSLQETGLVTQFLLRDKCTKTQRYSLDMPQISYLIIWKVGYFGYIISQSNQVGQPFRARYLDHQLLLYKILPLFF